MENINELAQDQFDVVEDSLVEEIQEVDALDETNSEEDTLDEVNPNEDLLEETEDNGLATIDDMEMLDFTPLDISDKLK